MKDVISQHVDGCETALPETHLLRQASSGPACRSLWGARDGRREPPEAEESGGCDHIGFDKNAISNNDRSLV